MKPDSQCVPLFSSNPSAWEVFHGSGSQLSALLSSYTVPLTNLSVGE